jgi:hypothetical protein
MNATAAMLPLYFAGIADAVLIYASIVWLKISGE